MTHFGQFNTDSHHYSVQYHFLRFHIPEQPRNATEREKEYTWKHYEHFRAPKIFIFIKKKIIFDKGEI